MKDYIEYGKVCVENKIGNNISGAFGRTVAGTSKCLFLKYLVVKWKSCGYNEIKKCL